VSRPLTGAVAFVQRFGSALPGPMDRPVDSAFGLQKPARPLPGALRSECQAYSGLAGSEDPARSLRVGACYASNFP